MKVLREKSGGVNQEASQVLYKLIHINPTCQQENVSTNGISSEMESRA